MEFLSGSSRDTSTSDHEEGGKRADTVRLFYAQYLEVKIKRDGQVPGWREWYDKLPPVHQRLADAYAYGCWVKIKCDERPLADTVAAGVAKFREAIKSSESNPDLSAAEVIRRIGETPVRMRHEYEAAQVFFHGVKPQPKHTKPPGWDRTKSILGEGWEDAGKEADF